MKTFKVLEFTDELDSRHFGKYAIPVTENELGGGNIPQLMTPQTTMKALKRIYPKMDFRGTRLRLVKLIDFPTNKA